MSRIVNQLARWYFSDFPLERGKWHVWTKVRNKLEFDETDVIEARTKFGFKMKLDVSEHIDKFIYFWSCWEPNETWVLKTLLRPGDIFIDVGAHIGYHSLLASMLVGENGKIYSFEPVPKSVNIFRENLALNQFKNIMIYDKAVSNESGFVKIGNKNGVGSQNNSMRVDEETSECTEVETVVLDKIIKDNEQIRFLKVDVEGAELLVMRGFTRHLKQANPPFILLEMNDPWLRELGGSSTELYKLMTEFKYKAYTCNNLRFRPLLIKDVHDMGLTDVLFSREDLI